MSTLKRAILTAMCKSTKLIRFLINFEGACSHVGTNCGNQRHPKRGARHGSGNKLDHLDPNHAKPDTYQQPAPARIAQRLRALLRARRARRPLSDGTLRSASGLAIKQREPAPERPTPAAEVRGRAAARIVVHLSGSPRSHQPLEGTSLSAWSVYCADYRRPQQ